MIELKNVTKRFGKKVVLSDINIKFPNTGLFIILGNNGVGKTTLLYILGLLDLDFEGDLYIDNLNIKNSDINYLREYRNKNVSYVFSKGNLIPYLSVKDNLRIGVKNENDIVKFIDLPDDQDVQTLSGGEELLLSLSHEVSLKKNIYLLDEVTAALDDDNLNKVIDILKKYARSISETHILVELNSQEIDNVINEFNGR